MDISQLLAELDEIQGSASWWQERPQDVTLDEIRSTRDHYMSWYSRAQQVIPDDRIETFRDAYTGGSFVQRIQAFLLDPIKQSPFYDPAEANPLIPRWQNPYSDHFAESIQIQRLILHEVLASSTPVEDELLHLETRMKRLPSAFRLLAQIGVAAIANEADLQAAMHPMLRILYEDVRREDCVSQFAGGASRVDFVLKKEKIILETKMTRISLNDRRLGEELLIDWGRYQSHPDCGGIFALIYDPTQVVDNEAALISDLTNAGVAVPTRVAIVR